MRAIASCSLTFSKGNELAVNFGRQGCYYALDQSPFASVGWER